MSYSIDAGNKFIRVTYGGTLNNEDLQGVLKEALKTDGKKIKLANRLEDIRELVGSKIGFDALSGFTANIRTIQLPRPIKSAILTSNSLQFGIARMFQSILEHPQIKVKIFSDEEEASKWLSDMD